MTKTKLISLLLSALALSEASASNEYEFSATWNSPIPILIKEQSVAPASEAAPITAKDGYILDRNGQEVHLWGAVLRITNQLLNSPRQDKTTLIKNMGLLGFNQIRFVGLDFFDPGIFQDWLETGDFPKAKMEKFCTLIEAARDNGMLYSIDINHISGKFESTSGPNNLSTKNKKGKVVQIYDTDILQLTNKWYTAFLKEKPPGCKHQFGNDPNYFYINIVNEDSIFFGYFTNFRFLSKSNMEMLETLFYNYTEEKSGTNTTQQVQNINSLNLNAPQTYTIHRRQLCMPGPDYELPGEWCKETVEFLTNLEKQYFLTIKESIRAAGYKNLITTTNNWYGYQNHRLNSEIGDATNTHIYFDPHRSRKLLGGNFVTLTNYSFITNPFNYSGWENTHIHRLFTSLTNKKPLFISEWNHPMWSDFAFEGPIILTATALLQNVSVLTTHQYLPRYEAYDADYSTDGFSVLGNPILFALLPSLSRAFRHIDKALSEGNAYQINSTNSDLKALSKIAMKPVFMAPYESLQDGFRFRIRNALFEERHQPSLKASSRIREKDHIISQPPIINWQNIGTENAHLIVTTENFRAVLGDFSNYEDLGHGIKVLPDGDGAITFVALDTNKIETAKSILITTVYKFRNTDELASTLPFGSKVGKVILRTGSAPTLMSYHPFDLLIESSTKGHASIRPLHMGNINSKPIQSKATSAGQSFHIGTHDTPWYILEYSGP